MANPQDNSSQNNGLNGKTNFLSTNNDFYHVVSKRINRGANKMTIKPNLASASNRASRSAAKANVPQSPNRSSSSTQNNLHQENGTRNTRTSKRRQADLNKYITMGVTFEAPKREPTNNGGFSRNSASYPVKLEHHGDFADRKPSAMELHTKVKDSDIKPVMVKQEPKETKTSEEPMELDPSFLYRDIVADRENDNDENLAPLFWDTYCKKDSPDQKTSQSRSVKGHESSFSFSNTKEESLTLLQIPRMLLDRKEGKLGKLRIYKSGRLELLDAKTGLVYDMSEVTGRNFCNNEVTKSDKNCDAMEEQDEIIYSHSSGSNLSRDWNPSMRRDVILLSNKQLVCLGSIENTEILIVRPQVEQILSKNNGCNHVG